MRISLEPLKPATQPTESSTDAWQEISAATFARQPRSSGFHLVGEKADKPPQLPTLREILEESSGGFVGGISPFNPNNFDEHPCTGGGARSREDLGVSKG